MDESFKQEIDKLTSQVVAYNEDEHLTFNEKVLKDLLINIREIIKEGKYDEAKALLEANLPAFQEFDDKYADEDENLFRTFNEAFDELLFNVLFKGDKKVYYMPMLSVDAFITYGNLLFREKRYSEAIQYYKKVLHRNPTETHAAFQLLECYKAKGDMKSFFEYAVDAFKFMYRPMDVARIHRCLGYYFVERRKFELAFLYYNMSRNFDPTNQGVLQELKFIAAKLNNKFPSMEDAKKLTEKDSLPFGPDKNMLGLAYTMGNNSKKVEKYTQSKYFFEILYGLFKDPQLKAILDEINQATVKTN